MRHPRFFGFSVFFLILGFALPAFAGNWGENWGEMTWGSVAAVPTLGWLGLVLLLALLVVTVFWKMKRVSLQAGVTLSVLLLVPFLMAPHITTWEGLTWYTFINGEPANADQVNQNFSALADALDVTVPNSFANSGIADAGEVNANFEALRTAVDTFTGDLAAATQATQTAGSNACTQAGGTWNGQTSTCTPASSYNCFVGGFCAMAAIVYPPNEFGYTNVYAGDPPPTQPALFPVGCNTMPASARYSQGGQLAATGPDDFTIFSLIINLHMCE